MMVKVLLVEDDEDDYVYTRDLLSEIEAESFTLDWAASYEEGLEAVAREEHAVCLLDYRLGERTGLDFLNEATARGCQTPMIFLTVYRSLHIDVAAMKAGAVDYLVKGRIEAAALERSIRYAIARKEAEQARAQQVSIDTKRASFQEVLRHATAGRMTLCATPNELPPPLPSLDDDLPISEITLQELRRRVRHLSWKKGFSMERWQDLEGAVGEAAMNAIVHGKGGNARSYSNQRTIQVWIEDCGPGIPLDQIPRAILEPGYTTAGSLGFGFFLMLRSVDRIWLLTGPGGTTVVLEQDRIVPQASLSPHHF